MKVPDDQSLNDIDMFEKLNWRDDMFLISLNSQYGSW